MGIADYLFYVGELSAFWSGTIQQLYACRNMLVLPVLWSHDIHWAMLVVSGKVAASLGLLICKALLRLTLFRQIIIFSLQFHLLTPAFHLLHLCLQELNEPLSIPVAR